MQSTTNPQLEKAQLRSAVLQKLNRLTKADKKQKSELIQKQLKEKLRDQSGAWSAFQAMTTEPDINWNEVSSNIEWCYPVVNNQQMHFRKSVSKFNTSSMGFLEPVDGELVDIQQINGAIIPGLAFDKFGSRVGRGRGYYDKSLKNMTGSIIGVCFETAFLNEVPTEEHDLKCHIVITENQSVIIEGVRPWN